MRCVFRTVRLAAGLDGLSIDIPWLEALVQTIMPWALESGRAAYNTPDRASRMESTARSTPGGLRMKRRKFVLNSLAAAGASLLPRVGMHSAALPTDDTSAPSSSQAKSKIQYIREQ